jgi:hypothetical protein
LTVCNAPKQARFLERIGSLRAGWHPARFLKGIHRGCILAADIGRSILLHDHILVRRLEFAAKPTECFRRSHRIGCEMLFVNVVAVNAFKRAYIESQARWLSSYKHHLGLTFWAAMALD